MTKAQGAALDLSAFGAAVKRQNDGIEVDILGMDGETPTGLKIRVAGPDSKRAQAAQETMADELVAQQVDGRMKAADATKRGIRYLAKITLGWSPESINDGEEEFAFSEAAAVKLYTKYRYIREQVDRAAGSRTRFTNG